ncbi:hypothetical protein CHARACLAT_005461 [Characodon lateralis]|uniref:Secreted protein n=1 Tax=Characodon lateralis TaxID=208331 RepID=A0ABU7ER39_9TELE|nr:hypothetical protein [Characodon lateralis]
MHRDFSFVFFVVVRREEAEYAGVCTLLIRIPAFSPPNFHHELHGSKCIATWTRHLCGTGLGVLLLE